MKKTLISFALVVSICFLICFTVSAFDDMPNDWSTPALQSAVANGLLTGDGNLLKPRDTLTRAQMATIITRAFGAVKEADISEFSDVPETAWYCDEMSKAYYMNVFRGDGAGHMNPDSPVTRQEAFVVIARALCLDENASADVLSKFSDADKVSSWAKGTISSMVLNSYVNGSDGKINPTGNITRAEFAQLMYNVITLYVDDESDIAKIPEAKGNVLIRENVALIDNVACQRDLIVADGVVGNLTLKNVNVGARVIIRGDVDLSYKGECPEILAISSNVVLTLEKDSSVDKVNLPAEAKLVDNSKTETPVTPTIPTTPVTPPPSEDVEEEDVEEEDVWTGFH